MRIYAVRLITSVGLAVPSPGPKPCSQVQAAPQGEEVAAWQAATRMRVLRVVLSTVNVIYICFLIITNLYTNYVTV